MPLQWQRLKASKDRWRLFVYGADPTAGVINFIFRKDFKRHELSAVYGDNTASSDVGRSNFSYAGGFAIASSDTTLVIDCYDREN